MTALTYMMNMTQTTNMIHMTTLTLTMIFTQMKNLTLRTIFTQMKNLTLRMTLIQMMIFTQTKNTIQTTLKTCLTCNSLNGCDRPANNAYLKRVTMTLFFLRPPYNILKHEILLPQHTLRRWFLKYG